MQFRPPRFDKLGRFGGHSYNLWPAFKANRALLNFTLEGLLYTTQSTSLSVMYKKMEILFCPIQNTGFPKILLWATYTLVLRTKLDIPLLTV